MSPIRYELYYCRTEDNLKLVSCWPLASITSDLQPVNSQLIGRANTPITFTVTSNTNISSALFHWDFGDQNVKIGQGSAFAKVQHSYSTYRETYDGA